MKKITVLGGGSWGVTLANVLAEKGHNVVIWTIEDAVKNDINTNHRNSKYLGDAPLSKNLSADTRFEQATEGTHYYLWAIPTQIIRTVLSERINQLNLNVPHISVSKGLEVSTQKRVSEIFKEYGVTNFVYFAGPSHAEEVCHQMATTITSISESDALARDVQELFSTEYLRVYTNNDLVGSELSGAFKNVVAIAAGICDGSGLGDNAKAALITRSLVELSRLALHFGADKTTISGLTGIGDLIATCCSKHSRNRHVGNELGKGRNLQEILDEMVMVAEGVKTSEAFYQLATAHNIEMPIVDATYQVMFNNASVEETVKSLMTRELKAE